MGQEEHVALDFFSGGVPALAIFDMSVADIRSVMNKITEEDYRPKVSEICFIGLMSYFEAFCKDHFASLINICPPLIRNLDLNDRDTKINAVDVLSAHNHVRRLGFLLSENYEFGSAKQINGLFKCLLNFSPFSQEERREYEKLQRDRNLLVHHGGIYTQRYLSQAFADKSGIREPGDAAYLHSLVLDYSAVENTEKFLMSVAKKTVSASVSTLIKYVEHNEIHLMEKDRKAIEYLHWTL